MSAPNKKTFVSNTGIATSTNVIASGGNVTQKLSQGFPTGNQILKRMRMRYSGNLNLAGAGPAGSIITRGGLQNIRSIFLQTPQHNALMNNIDGLGLHDLLYLRKRKRPINTDISSAGNGTPSFEYSLELPFEDVSSIIPGESSLDMFQVSYVELTINIGGATDFISGGTYTTETIQVLNLEIDADINPSPTASDIPVWQPYINKLVFPVNQTTTGFQLLLAYGNRLIKRYLIEQRNNVSFAQLANTVCGAADQDRLSMVVGGYDWWHRIEWLAAQDQMVDDFGLADGVITGAVAVEFGRAPAVGFKASDLLGLNSPSAGSPVTEIDIDSTSVTNGSYWVYEEGLKPPPQESQRPAATAPGK